MQRYVICDPIQGPIELSTEERELLATRAFRRLGRIRQLALLHLLYPVANYSRLEHSLGVLQLTTRIFDIVTDPANVTEEVRAALPELSSFEQRRYWRRVVRVAALCHDLGHLPFSHAAEKSILPPGWNHERLSCAVIMHDEVGVAIEAMGLRRLDVAKVAVGERAVSGQTFTPWEKIVSEIVVSNAFGADRLDYLQRDPYRAGLRCPGFDCVSLIHALRILPAARKAANGRAEEPCLGVLASTVPQVESLVRARHFLFARIYHQPAACINNLHLGEFLRAWFPGGRYPVAIARHLEMDDVTVQAEAREAARDFRASGHEVARRLCCGDPFQLVYTRCALSTNGRSAGHAIQTALARQFGEEHVRADFHSIASGPLNFPVQIGSRMTARSNAVSDVFHKSPAARVEHVFVAPQMFDRAQRWLTANEASFAASTN